MQHTGAFAVKNSARILFAAFTILLTLTITSCAAPSAPSSVSQRSGGGGSKAQICKRGDQMIASPNQCIQDNAACYELTNGKWCTGERGNTCPSGSVKIPKGTVCPRGARCIDYGESLSCAIQFR